MASIETETVVKLVISKEQVVKMQQALAALPAQSWIRLVVSTETGETWNDALEIYAQGPNGEEIEI